MITTKQATAEDRDIVLSILDHFRTVCMSIISPEAHEICTAAKEFGAPVFEYVVNNPEYGAVFLALENNKCIGAISIYKIPQIRKGLYRAEIEEMFAIPDYHGKGVGELLMKEAEKWARENNIASVQLISNFHLLRAHSFYKKMGFTETSKSFEKKL